MKVEEILNEVVKYPAPKDVEKYVADTYYIYDEETGRIQVEDRADGGRIRAKFTIRYGDNRLSVEADDFVDDPAVQKRETEIYRDIINNAGKE